MQTASNGATAPAVPAPPPKSEPLISDAQFTGPQKQKAIDIQLTALKPGKNPRRTFDPKKLDELAESLKVKGQQSPILARPDGNSFEVVYGERRFRAAKLAGWETISAFVREMSDSEALEEALLENGQRADVDPYEEAEAFRQLHVTHKHSPEEIAVKVGKSLATIYARLKLAELDSKARAAAQDAEIPASTAMLVARIVGAERQREAMKEIAKRQMSYREAHEHIQQDYMLSLADAQFDTTDAALFPVAGSCAKCPKRTGNQRELFSDIKAKDVCTDPGCFREKQTRFTALRIDEAKAKGVQVLDGKEAKEVISYGHVGGGFIDPDSTNYNDEKQRSYRETLGKKLPPVTLVKDPDSGKLREIVKLDDIRDLVRPKERKQSAEELKEDKAREREHKKREADRLARRELRAAAIAKAEKSDLSTVALRGLVLLFSSVDDYATADARGWLEADQKTEVNAEKIVFSKIVDMSLGELRGLLVELAIDTSGFGTDTKDAFDLLIGGLGLDSKASTSKAVPAKKAAKPASIPCTATGKNGKACTASARHKGSKGQDLCASHVNSEKSAEKKAAKSLAAKPAKKSKAKKG